MERIESSHIRINKYYCNNFNNKEKNSSKKLIDSIIKISPFALLVWGFGSLPTAKAGFIFCLGCLSACTASTGGAFLPACLAVCAPACAAPTP